LGFNWDKTQVTSAKLCEARSRGFITSNEFKKGMAAHGIDSSTAELLFSLSTRPLARSQVVKLRQVGRISEKEYYEYMEKAGYSGKEAELSYYEQGTIPEKKDIENAYWLGFIEKTDVQDYYRKLGYSDFYVTVLTETLVHSRKARRWEEKIVLKVQRYIRGEIEYAELESFLDTAIDKSDIRKAVLDVAFDRRKVFEVTHDRECWVGFKFYTYTGTIV